jgi:hypothetical protein
LFAQVLTISGETYNLISFAASNSNADGVCGAAAPAISRVAHGKWFRAQVEEAIREADAPGAAPSNPHEVVKADMAAQRKALKARIAKAGA